MSRKLVNLSRAHLWVPLNSGENVRLAPGEAAEQIDDHEVKGNPTITKLQQQQSIRVEGAQEGAAAEDLEAPVVNPEVQPEDTLDEPQPAAAEEQPEAAAENPQRAAPGRSRRRNRPAG